jgi:hypothetical protein
VAMQPAPLYIVASPRPRAGKTLLARLLMEYFLDNGRPLVGFDLNPRGPVLAGRFPKLVWPVDIGDIRGQMELFDRLVADTASTKVIDVGYGPFEQFFTVIGDIGFAEEARRRGMDAIVFFLTDQAIATVRIYAKLQERMTAIFQPVHNESASLMASTEDFPPTCPECGTIRMPRLSQVCAAWSTGRASPSTPTWRTSRAALPRSTAGSRISTPNFAISSCGC